MKQTRSPAFEPPHRRGLALLLVAALAPGLRAQEVAPPPVEPPPGATEGRGGRADSPSQPGAAGPPAAAPGAVDRRRAVVRDTNSDFAWTPPATLAAWQARAAWLSDHVLAAAGLLPMPPRGPVRAVVTAVWRHDDVIIENLAFESFPGCWVAANLYRPAAGDGPFPGVLCPHGHWGDGRTDGGRFAQSEQASVPMRGIDLARAGMVALAYDMVGWGETRQLLHAPFGGAAARRAGASLAGVQLWNSLRAFDLLAQRPEVDAGRLACTGGSGGATQTFLLAAVEPRLSCAAPVNMISFTMQGGCECENPPLLRVDACNPELAALAAPRPLLLVSASGDWTAATARREFPAIRAVYGLFGREDALEHFAQEAGHNYNRAARERVVAFLRRHLAGNDRPFVEQATEISTARLRVFGAGIERPAPWARAGEAAAGWIAFTRNAAAALFADPDSSRRAAQAARALSHLCALRAPDDAPRAFDFVRAPPAVRGAGGAASLALTRAGMGDRVPLTIERPADRPARGLALLAHPDGRAAPALEEWRRTLLARGVTVATIDPYGVAPREGRVRGRFFRTFYRSEAAEQAQDLVTAAAFLRRQAPPGTTLALVGLAGAGLPALLAAGSVPELFDRAAADVADFDPARDYETRLPDPGHERVQSLTAALIARAGRETVIARGTALRRASEALAGPLPDAAWIEALTPAAPADRWFPNGG